MSRKTTYPNIDKLLSDGATKVNTDGATSDYVVLVKNGEQVKMTLAEFITFLNANGIGGSVTSTSLLGNNIINTSIPAGSTYYAGVTGNAFNASEAARKLIISSAITVTKMTIYTSSAQPLEGSLVITLRKNGSDTALTKTIAADSAAGVYSATGSISVAAGDYLSIKAANGDPSNVSATIVSTCLTITI